MNNTKLQDYIHQNCVNVSALARKMGVTRQSLTGKIKGDYNFSQGDLFMIKKALNLSDAAFISIFFTPDDEKLSTKEAV